MIYIYIGPEISNQDELFSLVSKCLNTGQSFYSGWDAFHDILFMAVKSIKDEVIIIDCSQINEQDSEIFSEIVCDINDDIGENKVKIVRCRHFILQ